MKVKNIHSDAQAASGIFYQLVLIGSHDRDGSCREREVCQARLSLEDGCIHTSQDDRGDFACHQIEDQLQAQFRFPTCRPPQRLAHGISRIRRVNPGTRPDLLEGYGGHFLPVRQTRVT